MSSQAVSQPARHPTRRDALLAMFAMLATLAVATAPLRLLLARVIEQNAPDWPYNPAVTRIAGLGITQLLEVVAVLTALAALFRITRYGSFAELGLDRTKARWLPVGLLLPLIALPVAAGIAFAVGVLPIDRALFPGPWPLFLVFAAATHAAWIEEIAFRGILMQGIERITNQTAAILLSAVAFVALHLFAPFDLTWPWWILVSAAGLGLGWAFYASGRALWLTIGLHWGFDLGLFLLLGLPGETRGWLHWPNSGPSPALSAPAGAVLLIGLVLTAIPLIFMLRRRREGEQ